MTQTNEQAKNSQIVYRGRKPEDEAIIVETKELASFKNRSHSEQIRLNKQFYAYLDELDKIGQECDFSQNNTDLIKVVESAKNYTLTIPDQIRFNDVYVQSLTGYVKSVLVSVLRLSKGIEDYDMRMQNFREIAGIKILMEDASILKSEGADFFERLEASLVELADHLPEGTVMNIVPPRGLEGLARSFGSFKGWITFLSRVKELGLNIAVLGQTEMAQISLQLTLSLYSGSFNLYQVLGMMSSTHSKTVKSGRTNFFNNYSNNYTLSTDLLKSILSQE